MNFLLFTIWKFVILHRWSGIQNIRIHYLHTIRSHHDLHLIFSQKFWEHQNIDFKENSK
jgi:hypothetical protein